MKSYRYWAPLAPLLFFLSTPMLRAEPSDEAGADPRAQMRQEFESAFDALEKSKRFGPVDIAILDQATLHLPEGFAYAPNPAAARFMELMGNRVGEGFVGLIMPAAKEQNGAWLVTATFEKSGYIRDDDARNWNVDDMLANLRAGTEESNKLRAERGIPELEVLDWAERPNYDADSRRLAWSLAVRNKGAPADEPQSVNYNTYALGREGFVSLNLVTNLSEIERRKPLARALLAALDFKEGKRYADFNADTDHAAEYGLAALVGGVMAKKLGLFALGAAFLAKFGKVIALAAVALFGLFGRRIRGKTGKGGGGAMDA
jgi:uncharacterized membrane-anchored protein